MARIVAEHVSEDQIRYRVREAIGGGWWISASKGGFRCSNTLHTRMEWEARRWIAAVKLGRIRIDR